MLVAVGLFAVAPMLGGNPGPTVSTTTTIVGLDPFDIELQSTSTTTTEPVVVAAETPAEIGEALAEAAGW